MGRGAEHLKQHAEETAAAFAADPASAKGGGRTSVRLGDEVTCQIQDGPWRLVADLPADGGGAGQGPDPGVLIRAALGSCLAMDIATWAARMEVPLTDVQVDVESEIDARGMYGVGDNVPPGYQRVRCQVRVESPAAEADVRRVVEKAETHNARLHDLRQNIPVERELIIESAPS